MKIHRIATIPGDGIGKEVVPAGRQVLEAVAAASGGFAFDFQDFGWGGDWYRAHGEMMPTAWRSCAGRTPSSSARPATRTSPTTSRCGACA